MILKKEEKINLITNLNQQCIDFFNEKKYQQAFVIWKALLIAAAKNFLSKKELTVFLLQTTKTILPILDVHSIREVLNLYAIIAIDDAVESECRSDVHLFEADLRIAAKTNVAYKPIIPNMIADCPISLLGCYTSAYQCEKTEKKEKLTTINKITNCEKDFLSNYFIYAWQTFETCIDNQLTMTDYYEALHWLNRVIQCNQTYVQTEKQMPDWQRYRQLLKDYREKCVKALPTLPLKNDDDVDQVVTAQRNFNKHIRQDFLTTIINDIISLLGEAPCAFSILGLGSLSRDEFMLFSDLDLMIVLPPDEKNKPLVKAYFAAFLKLFEFKLQSLGESARRSEPKGMLLDDGISASFDGTELVRAIGSCDELIKEYGPDAVINDMQWEKIQSANFYTILNAVYIHGSGDINGYSGENLFTQYQNAIQDHLNSEFRPNVSVKKGLIQKHLPLHRKEFFAKKSKPIQETDVFAIKEDHASCLYYLANDLALLTLPIKNTLEKTYHTTDIWQALADAKILDQATVNFAKRSVVLAMQLNIFSENFYGQQLKPKLIALSDNAREAVYQWMPEAGSLSAGPVYNQLKCVFLNPTIENIFAIKQDTYLQLAASEWLLIQPLLLMLENKDISELDQIKNYNFLEKHFIALLQNALGSQTENVFKNFIQSVKDYIHYTKTIFPVTSSAVIEQIKIKELSEEKQLLLLDLLGRDDFPIEKEDIYLALAPSKLNHLLYQAIRLHHVGAINLLLRAGASVNRKDEAQQTALHIFTRNIIDYTLEDATLACHLLLNASDAFNEYDQEGYTPLMWLIYSASNENLIVIQSVLQDLLKHGANINAVNFHTGYSILDKAMELQNPTAFSLFVELGASQVKDVDEALTFIDKCFSNEQKKSVRSQLEKQNPKLAWRLALQQLTTKNKTHKDARCMVGVESGECYLLPNLKVKKTEHGHHDVYIYSNDDTGKLCIKHKPSLPGIEFSVNEFARLLFGHGTPYTELFRTQDAKGNPVPLLVSQVIDGENLHHVLTSKEGLEKLKQLDPKKFTEMLFLSLLVLLEDGFPTNYQLVEFINEQGEKKYRIVCVDNDHAYVDVKKLNAKNEYELQAKCILWFLDQMKDAIDPKARDAFLKHNPNEIFKGWLDALEVAEKKYYALFKGKERTNIFSDKNAKKEKKETGIIFPIRKYIGKLFWRFVLMQEVLKKYPHISGLDFIQKVLRELGNLPTQAFNQGDTPLARFEVLERLIPMQLEMTSGVYGTFASASTILEMQGINAKEIAGEVNPNGPLAAKKELSIIATEIKDFLQIKEALIAGDLVPFERMISGASLKEKILKGFDFGIYKDLSNNKSIQRRLINDLKKGGFTKLTIKNCSELTDKDLADILKNSPGLTSLTLIGCEKITKEMMAHVMKYGQSLAKLSLEKLPTLEQLVLRLPSLSELIIRDIKVKSFTLDTDNLIKLQLISFSFSHHLFSTPKVHELILDNCFDVTSLELAYMKKLQHIQINNCLDLKEIITDTKCLQSLMIDNSHQLTFSGLEKIAQHTFDLQKLIITNCNGLMTNNEFTTKFLMRFPFLFGSHLHKYRNFFVEQEIQNEIIIIVDNALINYSHIDNSKKCIVNELISNTLTQYLSDREFFIELSNSICDEYNLSEIIMQHGKNFSDIHPLLLSSLIPYLPSKPLNADDQKKILANQLNELFPKEDDKLTLQQRIITTYLLGTFAPDDSNLIVPLLCKKLQSKDSELRKATLWALKSYAPYQGNILVPELIPLLINQKNRWDNQVAEVLIACAPSYSKSDATQIYEQFKNLLTHQSISVRQGIIKVLETFEFLIIDKRKKAIIENKKPALSQFENLMDDRIMENKTGLTTIYTSYTQSISNEIQESIEAYVSSVSPDDHLVHSEVIQKLTSLITIHQDEEITSYCIQMLKAFMPYSTDLIEIFVLSELKKNSYSVETSRRLSNALSFVDLPSAVYAHYMEYDRHKKMLFNLLMLCASSADNYSSEYPIDTLLKLFMEEILRDNSSFINAIQSALIAYSKNDPNKKILSFLLNQLTSEKYEIRTNVVDLLKQYAPNDAEHVIPELKKLSSIDGSQSDAISILKSYAIHGIEYAIDILFNLLKENDINKNKDIYLDIVNALRECAKQHITSFISVLLRWAQSKNLDITVWEKALKALTFISPDLMNITKLISNKDNQFFNYDAEIHHAKKTLLKYIHATSSEDWIECYLDCGNNLLKNEIINIKNGVDHVEKIDTLIKLLLLQKHCGYPNISDGERYYLTSLMGDIFDQMSPNKQFKKLLDQNLKQLLRDEKDKSISNLPQHLTMWNKPNEEINTALPELSTLVSKKS